MVTLSPKRKQQSDDERFQANLFRMADLALEKKAQNLKIYHVAGLTLTADALVLCTVTSEPQMKAVVNNIKEGMKSIGVRALHTEGSHQDNWLIVDYGDILFHIFREQAREFYDLDGLWADAPEIEIEPDTA